MASFISLLLSTSYIVGLYDQIVEGCAKRGAACIRGQISATGRVAAAVPSASACHLALRAIGNSVASVTLT